MSAALIVVQARAGSSRLPGKVLADVAGMPMLEFQLRRMLPVLGLADATIVLATSDLPIDDPVAEVGRSVGVAVVRGSEADVLGRYAIALARHPADTVVRITGDCPLTDPVIIAGALDLHRRSDADYTSNVLPRTFPKGLDVEVLSARALRAAELEATEQPDREHVTPFVYRRPERFRLATLSSGHDLGEEWWTVDTADDLTRIRQIAGAVPDPLTASWNRILAVVGRGVKPRPGQVHLRPLPPPEPGTAPWTRTWEATVDARPIGTVAVAAGAGTVDRTFEVGDEWLEPCRQELHRLLGNDQQTRA